MKLKILRKFIHFDAIFLGQSPIRVCHRVLCLVCVCVLTAVYCCEQAADVNNVSCYLLIFLEIGSYFVVGNPRFNASESIQLFTEFKEETVYEMFKKIEPICKSCS